MLTVWPSQFTFITIKLSLVTSSMQEVMQLHSPNLELNLVEQNSNLHVLYTSVGKFVFTLVRPFHISQLSLVLTSVEPCQYALTPCASLFDQTCPFHNHTTRIEGTWTDSFFMAAKSSTSVFKLGKFPAS